MTITTTDNFQAHVANGEVFFPISFPFVAAADIRVVVVLDNTRLSPPFIVTPAGDAPAGVLFESPPPIGSVVRIWRSTSPLQEQVWRAGVEYPARVHEAAHDRRALVDIDLNWRFEFTLRTPGDEPPIPPLPSAADRAWRVLTFDSRGDPIPGPLWDGYWLPPVWLPPVLIDADPESPIWSAPVFV